MKLIKIAITIIALIPIFSLTACQSLGLYKLGFGEREDPIIEEERRVACQQPRGSRISKDKCGRTIYKDGSIH